MNEAEAVDQVTDFAEALRKHFGVQILIGVRSRIEGHVPNIARLCRIACAQLSLLDTRTLFLGEPNLDHLISLASHSRCSAS